MRRRVPYLQPVPDPQQVAIEEAIVRALARGEIKVVGVDEHGRTLYQGVQSDEP